MLLRNSIFARVASNRYMLTLFTFDMLPVATRVDCAFFLIAPQGISSASVLYRVLHISLSVRYAKHIERRVSGAYRR